MLHRDIQLTSPSGAIAAIISLLVVWRRNFISGNVDQGPPIGLDLCYHANNNYNYAMTSRHHTAA